MKYSELFRELSESQWLSKKEKHEIVFNHYQRAIEFYDELIGVLSPLVETSRRMWIEDKITTQEHHALVRKYSHAIANRRFFKNTSKRKLLKMALRWHWDFIQD